MKDIRLARRQLLSGLLLTVITLAVVKFLFIPQFQVFQIGWNFKNSSGTNKTLLYERLPYISPGDSTVWQKNLLDPLYSISEETDTAIFNVQGEPETAVMATEISPTAKKIAVTVTAYGSYFSLQKFVVKLTKQFPSLLIHSVEFKNADNPPSSSTENPVLEGSIYFDLYVNLRGRLKSVHNKR